MKFERIFLKCSRFDRNVKKNNSGTNLEIAARQRVWNKDTEQWQWRTFWTW